MDNIELKKLFEANNISLNVQNYVFGETNTPPSNITGLDWVNFFVKLIKAGYDAKNEVVSRLFFLLFKTKGIDLYLTEIKKIIKTDEYVLFSFDTLKKYNIDILNVLKQFIFTISEKSENYPFVLKYIYENFKNTLSEIIKGVLKNEDKRNFIINIIKSTDKVLSDELIKICLKYGVKSLLIKDKIKIINLFENKTEKEIEYLKIIINSFDTEPQKSIIESFIEEKITFEELKNTYTNVYCSECNIALKNIKILSEMLEQNFNDKFFLKVFKIAIIVSDFEILNNIINVDNYKHLFELFELTYKDFVSFLVQKYNNNKSVNYFDKEFDLLIYVLKNEYNNFIQQLPFNLLSNNFIEIVYYYLGILYKESDIKIDFLIYLTEKDISISVHFEIDLILHNEIKSDKVIKFAEENYNSNIEIKKQIAIKLLIKADKPEYEKIITELFVTEKENMNVFPGIEFYCKIKKIMKIFNISSEETTSFLLKFSEEKNIHKYKTIDVKLLKKLVWIYNNKEFSEEETNLVLNYFENNDNNIKNLKLLTTKESQTEFAKDIYLKWNRECNTVWMLKAVYYFGDDSLIQPFKCEIIELGKNKRGTVASKMLYCFPVIDSQKSLQIITHIFYKVKQKQIRKVAEHILNYISIQLNLTKDDMLDKLIEDFGFNNDGIIELNYGVRKFFISMNVDYELIIKDESGKVIKSLPKANASDDAVKAEEANTLFKNLKKTLKDETKVQLERLEENFSKKRYWSVENWVDLFVNNPVMKKFAITLIWGLYENDKPINTFRYNEDGTYSDTNDNTITLNNNYYVSMIHPIELKEEEIESWKTIITDYEIKQPFNQINREVFQKETTYEVSIEKFKDKQVGNLSLRNKLTKAGFVPNANYSGEFSAYIKDIEGQNITIAVNFSGDNTKNYATSIDCTMKNISFYRTNKVKDYYSAYKLFPQHMIVMNEISPVLYSEICYLISSVTK